MKKTRIFYWITTGLFALLMLFSGISSLAFPAPAIELFKTLNMPAYLIPFLSIAKFIHTLDRPPPPAHSSFRMGFSASC